jgi:hypothetical protein
MRFDDRTRITYAADTLVVRKVSGARQNLVTFADNAKALGFFFSRLAS